MGTPLNVKQLIIDPWSQVKGQVILWAAADDGMWKKVDDGDWVKQEFTFSDPLSEGKTYNDIAWVSVSGNICREDHLAFLGYYLAPVTSDPRAVIVSYVNGVFDDACVTPAVCGFKPASQTDAFDCAGDKKANLTQSQRMESWGLADNESTILNSIYAGTWSGPAPSYGAGIFANGHFGRNIPADAGYKVYARWRGDWSAAPGSYCFSLGIAHPDACAGGGYGFKQIGTHSSNWQTSQVDVTSAVFGSGGIDLLSVYAKVQFASPPAGTDILIDALWADAPAPPTFPYGVVVEHDQGRWAYFTVWTFHEGTPDQYLLHLYRLDFDEPLPASSFNHIEGPLDYGAVAVGHTDYDYAYPEHHLYPHTPYGYPADHLLVYGAQVDADLPGVWKVEVQETNGVCTAQQLTGRHPVTSVGKYVAHLSAATEDVDDLAAFINAHASGALELYRSLSGGASWFAPLTAPSGILRWNAAHRHPSGGDRIVIAPADKVQETKDGGETWLDRKNAALPGSISPTSIAWKWW